MDPRLFSKEQWCPLSKTLGSSGHILVPVDRNLIDIVWEDRPAPPAHGIHPLGLEFTGEFLPNFLAVSPLVHLSNPVQLLGKSWQDKVKDVVKEMEDKNSSMLLLTALDDIAC